MEVSVTRTDHGLCGEIRVPGDKSVSHRAVLFAAMADGVCHPTGILDSADVRATIGAVRALGARVDIVSERRDGLDLEVEGWGTAGPCAPCKPIDCGNSGTTCRLLMGVVAGWPVDVTLCGDTSLSRRPMKRIISPLSEMGSCFEASADGVLPVRVQGGRLHSIVYNSPVASAQVKSAILLAGIRATGTTGVIEPALSRDHTERLLPAFGVEIATGEKDGLPMASVTGPVVMRPYSVAVPGDPSSAAFLIAAALLVPGSSVTVLDVCLNPTRTGFLDVMRRMGADITVRQKSVTGAEPIGSVQVRYTPHMTGTEIVPDEIPGLIDEIPVLALLATQATGTTRFHGIGELRVKETDRLTAVTEGLTQFGADVRAGEDWLEITGPITLKGTRLSSLGDHRLAMTWAVAGLISSETTIVEDFEAVDVSYPAFLEVLEYFGAL